MSCCKLRFGMCSYSSVRTHYLWASQLSLLAPCVSLVGASFTFTLPTPDSKETWAAAQYRVGFRERVEGDILDANNGESLWALPPSSALSSCPSESKCDTGNSFSRKEIVELSEGSQSYGGSSTERIWSPGTLQYSPGGSLLPLLPITPTTGPTSGASGSIRSALGPFHFVFVGSNPVNEKVVQAMVVQAGHTVRTTSCAAEALKTTVDSRGVAIPIDCFLIEHRAETGTGLNVCSTLHAAMASRPFSVPMVVLASASGQIEEDRKAAYNAGAVDYVLQPFQPAELMIRCLAYVRVFRPSGSDRQAGVSQLPRHVALRGSGHTRMIDKYKWCSVLVWSMECSGAVTEMPASKQAALMAAVQAAFRQAVAVFPTAWVAESGAYGGTAIVFDSRDIAKDRLMTPSRSSSIDHQKLERAVVSTLSAVQIAQEFMHFADGPMRTQFLPLRNEDIQIRIALHSGTAHGMITGGNDISGTDVPQYQVFGQSRAVALHLLVSLPDAGRVRLSFAAFDLVKHLVSFYSYLPLVAPAWQQALAQPWHGSDSYVLDDGKGWPQGMAHLNRLVLMTKDSDSSVPSPESSFPTSAMTSCSLGRNFTRTPAEIQLEIRGRSNSVHSNKSSSGGPGSNAHSSARSSLVPGPGPSLGFQARVVELADKVRALRMEMSAQAFLEPLETFGRFVEAEPTPPP